MFLKKILREKREKVKEAKRTTSKRHLIKALEGTPDYNRKNFKAALQEAEGIALIAEIKRESPSKGLLREKFNLHEIARTYEKNGASAISVLTDEPNFAGRPEYIEKVKEVMSLPVLRKDFIIDEYQIFESRLIGADAILLIARLLSTRKLRGFLNILATLKMPALVEVHTEADLNKALKVGADIIGINNRDLDTLKVDTATTEKIKPLIPEHVITVAESGISTHADIEKLKALGIKAVLIGGAFMQAEDIGAKMQEIMHGQG